MSASEAPPSAAGSVRRLVAADASAYRLLMLDAYATHPNAFTSTVEERAVLPLRWWEERLGVHPEVPSVVFGAFDADGVLVGAAGLSFETRVRARHKATLFGMSVAATARRGGHGWRLVQAVLAHAHTCEGLRLVQLTVTEGNEAARTLYERCGFRAFGLEPLAIAVGAQLYGKIHMWCDLEAGPAH